MKKRLKKGMKQALLPFGGRGGPRKGAGRKPKGRVAGVSHAKRAAVPVSYPVHITIKLRKGLPSLRTWGAYAVLRDCLAAACGRKGLRLVHYSVQSNHIHLICEATGRPSISRGMQGLCIRIAKRFNAYWGRKGQVFADRYHEVVLRSPRQVRNALCYVLHNAKKHGLKLTHALDPFSSAPWFDAWKEKVTIKGLDAIEDPTAEARSYLLSVGWKRARSPGGRVSIYDKPG